MKREREKIFDAICIWRRSFCRSTRTRGEKDGDGEFGAWTSCGACFTYFSINFDVDFDLCHAILQRCPAAVADWFVLPSDARHDEISLIVSHCQGVERGGQQMIWHLHDMGKWHKVCGARQKLFALGLTRFNVVWGCFASAWKWNLHRSVWPNPSPVGQHLVSITSRACQSSSDQMRNITQPERGREN